MTFIKNFLTALSGLLVPIIALLTTYIAYRQYKLDKDKFKFNLYNKRTEVFQSLMNLFEYVMREGDLNNKELNKFSVAIDKGYFLFDSEINSYLSGVLSKCFLLRKCARELNNPKLGRGEKRDKLAEEEEKIFLWFGKQQNEVKKLFGKYLKFKK